MSVVLSIQQWLGLSVSNDVLMSRYAETGEQALLARLYDECGDDLYHFLLAMTSPDTAMDVAQKTWVTVIEKRHLYAASGRFESWLFTLGRHALIDEIRKQRRLTYDDALLSRQLAPDSATYEQSDRFRQALAALPFAQREAFCLQQEGFGLQEIATICHSNRETIKTRLRYARENLKSALEAAHE